MKYFLLLWLCISYFFSGQVQAFTQAELAEFAKSIELKYAVKSNFTSDAVPKSQVELILENKSSRTLAAAKDNWVIYFHAIRKQEGAEQHGLILQHVQGDLHSLSPGKNFKGLQPGQQLRLTFSPSASMVSYSDWMPRAFITAKGLKPEVFANTDTEDFSRFVEPYTRAEQLQRFNKPSPDLYPIATSQSRFVLNQQQLSAFKKPEQLSIVPSPQQISYQRGQTKLSADWVIYHSGRLTSEATYLQQQLKQVSGLSLTLTTQVPAKNQPHITMTVQKVKNQAEAYQLVIDDKLISLSGNDNAGAFYAVQSLLALLPVEGERAVLPNLTITDWPRFGWRGLHYDMARNFHGKAVTLRMIDQLARYKLNKLHLHLTEDEGWRIEIPGLPELTQIGANRCFDLSERNCLLTQLGTGPFTSGNGNGYYSTADFIEILKYAAERHIEIIPEIDMPGHARAAVKAMQARYLTLKEQGREAEATQYLLSDPLDQSKYMTVQNYTDNSINVCLPSTYAFVDKVIYELQQMYRQAGLKLSTFHMGGDETGAGSWTASPACAQLIATPENSVAGVADLKPYFVAKVAQLAANRQLTLGGWEDGLMYDAKNPFNRQQFANEKVYANVWDNIWEWGVADRAHRLANAGYQVVLSHGTHLYFDHPYEAHPEERGYYWAARFTDVAKVFGYMPDHLYANADKTREGKVIENLEVLLGQELPALEKPENILGIQGQIWTETIRTAEQLEQMLYPRLLALAERAWHKAEWEAQKPDTKARQQDWQRFGWTLTQKELPRLAEAGVALYLPPPGAVLQDGVLLANSAWPGLVIEYSEDQGQSWLPYTEAVKVSSDLLLRTKAKNGATSRVTKLD
ncbi:MAG: carbohydate-binding domain-containing protein [Gammaproteobacteria bacterium]|nr:carbohydate-binding domain-containing protein [Gammaproteobacteria bacterium]MBU2056127.1 carbohydate-binding domain-containing protein [Gammaproteobacteria bacterium]MBU2175687.1 carbohydate-binding domain-containing protein [Gammaproteobacteria bacterium]MBU2245394.1 carbohydate-binding domain-containing protein [Gammaproteobacteria bacterium]MBU2394335.1 carbohydate-binding domain-containing protein [Gammaproteobacteria bacterium]